MARFDTFVTDIGSAEWVRYKLRNLRFGLVAEGASQRIVILRAFLGHRRPNSTKHDRHGTADNRLRVRRFRPAAGPPYHVRVISACQFSGSQKSLHLVMDSGPASFYSC